MEHRLKEFQAAVSLHALLSDQPKPTRVCAQALGLKMSYAKVVVLRLSKGGLIQAVKGNGKNAGLTKNSKLEDVYKLYGVSLDVKVEPLKPQKVKCDICFEFDFISNEERICDACLKETETPKTVRVARCGHETNHRYFNCEKCQPLLDEESFEFSLK